MKQSTAFEMNTTVFKEFKFCAAHHLTIPGHKCSQMHGHNYRVVVECAGAVNADGMVIDFHTIKESVDPIIAQLDHSYINDIIPYGTTSECIGRWIAEQVSEAISSVKRVTIWETDSCGAIIEL
jgi:6-pyruvoyltetrahydropterin/6-carboxytetrahydropterin synthase